MTKLELIRELSESMNISQELCKATLNALFDSILEMMDENNRFIQTGFGSFRTEVSNERESFNPHLKKHVLLPKKRKLKFKPSAKLKAEINE